LLRRALLYFALSACGRIEFADRPDADVDAAIDAAGCGNAFCPDPSFDGDGATTIDVGGVDNTGFGHHAIAERPDGRIVVVGRTLTDHLVVGLREDGARDPQFGTAGIATIDLGYADEVSDGVVIRPNGKLAIAGASDQFGVAAWVSDIGALELSHVTAIGAGSGVFNGLAVDAADRLTVAGQVRTTTTGFDLMVARLLPTGAADPTFNGGMLLQLDVYGGDEFGALAGLGPDGTTYVVGQAFRGAADFDGVLVRLLADGTRDPAYGTDGVASLDLGGTERFFDAAIAPDGSSIAVGLADEDFVLARFTAAGASAGATRLPREMDSVARSLVVLADGRIVIGGSWKTPAVGVLLLVSPAGDVLGTYEVAQRISAIKLDHAGRLLAVGDIDGTASDIFVTRLFVR
jgi:uncharacterized delta-60 repeat protein